MKIKIYSSTGILQNDIIVDGGELFNYLSLVQHPQDAQEAATKHYVDTFPSLYNADWIVGAPIDKSKLFANVSGDVHYTNTPDVSLTPVAIVPGNYTHVTVNYKGQVVSAFYDLTHIPTDLYFENILEVPTLTIDYVTNPWDYVLTTRLAEGTMTLTGELKSTRTVTEPQEVAHFKYLTDRMKTMRALFKPGQLKIAMPHAVSPQWLRANGAVLNRQQYPELYSAIGQTFSDVTYLPYQVQGQPWKQQSTFNYTRNPQVLHWSMSASGLPKAIAESQAIVTHNRVYLLGGKINGTPTNTVLTAAILENGAIGEWAEATPLNFTLSNHQAVVTSTMVYVLGGVINNYYASAIYGAKIQSDGTLGAWQSVAPLPDVVAHSQVFVNGSTLYVLGGYADGAALNSVYTNQIQPNGVLGEWSVGSALEWTVYNAQTVVTKGFVYLLGGVVNNAASDMMFRAPLQESGEIGAWTFSGYLPFAGASFQSLVNDNTVYLIGGNSVSSGAVGKVYSAQVMEDETIGVWKETSQVLVKVYDSALVATSGNLYLLGGNIAKNTSTAVSQVASFSGGHNDYVSLHGHYHAKFNTAIGYQGQPWKQQFPFNSQPLNLTGVWKRETDFPVRLYHSHCAVTEKTVYAIGGLIDGVGTRNVYSAAILPDGTLGNWVPVTPFPVEVYGGQCLLTRNHLYLVGGVNSSAVYRASVNPQGGIGSWNLHNNLPEPVGHSQLAVTTNRVYLLGKQNKGVIFTTDISAEGMLGEWTQAGSLPTGVYSSHVAVSETHVYLIGGYGNAALTSVYKAKIKEDGTLSEWLVEKPLPVSIHAGQVLVSGSKIYILGGFVGGLRSMAVHRATIEANGVLSTWTSQPGLPVALSDFQVFATSSRLYILGGRTNLGDVSTVYSTPFSGGTNNYLSLINGAVFDPEFQFKLPDLTDQAIAPMEYFIRTST